MNHTTTYQKLKEHQQQFSHSLALLFAENPQRFQEFSLRVGDILFDYSKQRLDRETLKLLCQLATDSNLESYREAFFSGEKINTSEDRAVLHPLLRDIFSSTSTSFQQQENADLKKTIAESLDRLESFSNRVRQGELLGSTQQPFRDILCLGIGGSELGPLLLNTGLAPYKTAALDLHFVSNIDGSLPQTLNKLDPRTTLCIISSKSFTTPETLENARLVKDWFSFHLGTEQAAKQHLTAVTANAKAASAFGISPEHIFEFWDWVGGRYSIWSAVGLPIILSIGMPHFKDFLKGAFEMDQHFKTAPLSQNMPVLMALIGLWNRNFLQYGTQAIVPYDQALQHLPAYLQQLEMESNGKSVDISGKKLNYDTAPVIWGGVGCNSQHAFMQLLHQGTQTIPVDFLIGTQQDNDPAQQRLLFSSCLSQAKALMEGVGHPDHFTPLSSEKICPGNRPSSMILYPKLTPGVLGSILALYEHKVFVQGVIWKINSFDQWGVEHGKLLAKKISEYLDKASLPLNPFETDSSTQGLIRFFFENAENAAANKK